MAEQQTGNYQLNQWGKSDRIMMEEFNSDNAKIDAALKQTADAVALCGNCQLATTSYVGTGSAGAANARTLTFEKAPLAVLIFGKEIGFAAPGSDVKSVKITTVDTNTTTWSNDNKTVTWYNGDLATSMLNSKDYTYHVVILYTA